MKSGRWHITVGVELPSQENIRSPGEKESYKYLEILEAAIKWKWKKKLKKNTPGEGESFLIPN